MASLNKLTKIELVNKIEELQAQLHAAKLAASAAKVQVQATSAAKAAPKIVAATEDTSVLFVCFEKAEAFERRLYLQTLARERGAPYNYGVKPYLGKGWALVRYSKAV